MQWRTTAVLTVVIHALGACSDTTTEPKPAEGVPALAVASNTWLARANLPNTERLGLTSAVVPNAAGRSVLYVIGGSSTTFAQAPGPTTGALNRVQAYDVSTNAWIPRKSLPVDAYKTNGAGVIGGKIYVSGGRRSGDKRYLASLLVYDPGANTWTQKRDMPTETWGGVTGVLNDRLYVLTCELEADCDEHSRLTLYRYDPATDQWTFLSTTPIALGGPMGGFLGGKFYATGGPEGALLAYDPATGAWETKSSLPGLRWSAAGVALAGKLYILGGFEGERGNLSVVRKTSVYDPGTNSWSTRRQMPSARFDITASRVVVDGQPRIQVVGGPRPGNNLQFVP